MRRAAAPVSVKAPPSPRLPFPVWFVATGAFAGYCPVAPGTAGSLVGAALALLVPRPSSAASLLLVPATFLLAVGAAGAAAAALRVPDPPVVVIDEVWGMWAAALAAPRRFGPVVSLGVLFRLFDIWKPFPVGLAQRLPGGWGIMADDVAAAAYALGTYHALAALATTLGRAG